MILDDSITSREMRAVEMNADYLGVTRLQMMENAGRAVAEAVMERFDSGVLVAVVCGLGGNGGDGLVTARHLAGAGFRVRVVLLGRPEDFASEEARLNWAPIEAMRGSVAMEIVRDSAYVKPLEADVIVDALIGTGVRGALASPYREMVAAINASRAFKVAVDIPTGMESDTGEAHGEAVRPDLTLTFHKPKAGMARARKRLGELRVVPIGITPEAELYTGPGDVYLATRRRLPEAHKGDFGRLLVVGGSETYSGAPALTGLGAYATGIDLVYVAAPETAASIIAGFSPSLVTVKLKGSRLSLRHLEEITSLLGRVEAVAIGPGLGLHDDTASAVNEIVSSVEALGLPMLLDADSLKAFAGSRRRLGSPAVFTPHRQEFKILTGRDVEGDLGERGEVVREEAARLNSTILLKGSVDVISDGAHTRLNWTGNPGMTVGGTGDVLSGVTAGLMAMGIDPFQAASAGAFVNGAAGDAAYEEKGYHLEPMDLVTRIPRVMEDALAGRLRPRRRGRQGY